MTPEIAKRLALAYPGLTKPATGEAGVADVSRYARKPQQIRPPRPLRPEIDKEGKEQSQNLPGTLDAEADAIEERAAIISEACPAPYIDTLARLNHQKPFAVSDAEWRQALDDAGGFLDGWGTLAAEMEWSAGDLFDVPREGRPGGLIWAMKGEPVEALGADHARLGDGRTIMRLTSAANRDGL